MTRRNLPLWSTIFVNARREARSSFDVVSAAGLVRDFPYCHRKSAQAARFSDEISQTLGAGQIEDAVTFLRTCCRGARAVWWACGCAKGVLGAISQETVRRLCWPRGVGQGPTTSAGRTALELGNQGHCDDALNGLRSQPDGAGGLLGSGLSVIRGRHT